MRIADTVHQAISNLGESGKIAWDVTKNFSAKNPNATPFIAKPAGVIERGFLGTMKVAVGKPLSWGLKTIDVTAAFLMTPLKWLGSAPGAYFKAFPRFAPISVAVGAATGIGSYIAHRNSVSLQQNFADAQQNMAMQAMAAQQQAAMGAVPQTYMNSVSPDLSAQLNQRLAAGKDGAGVEHVAAVEQARAAAVQPKTADLSAL